MKIFLASSEAVPFSKTGGLADVAGSLAAALAAKGHDVTLITPLYPQQLSGPLTQNIDPGGIEIALPMADRLVTCLVRSTTLPGSRAKVYLVEHHGYFDRPTLYGDGNNAYDDNCERFAFFSKVVVELARSAPQPPDILHAHDWQTALVPVLTSEWLRREPGRGHIASVLTIHNINFQGQFWHFDMPLTGLDWKYFNWRQLEFYGSLNLLKGGIVFADKVTTVSPTYAEEIQTSQFGCGMETVLRNRQQDLVGILNGIDVKAWNPATDPHLPRQYTADTLAEGKRVCKQKLQEEFGLPVNPDVPLLGMVSRFAEQKGFDLIKAALPRMLASELQLVFLGTGDPRYMAMVREAASTHPHRVAAQIGFDEGMAHRIEAGADLFLMPSRFEPCGLNQMYSMAYGTPPIVNRTGGLVDSVTDANSMTLDAGTATGIVFQHYAVEDFWHAITRALELFRTPEWERLQRNGMMADWSWDKSAVQYERVFQAALDRVSGSGD